MASRTHATLAIKPVQKFKKEIERIEQIVVEIE